LAPDDYARVAVGRQTGQWPATAAHQNKALKALIYIKHKG